MWLVIIGVVAGASVLCNVLLICVAARMVEKLKEATKLKDDAMEGLKSTYETMKSLHQITMAGVMFRKLGSVKLTDIVVLADGTTKPLKDVQLVDGVVLLPSSVATAIEERAAMKIQLADSNENCDRLAKLYKKEKHRVRRMRDVMNDMNLDSEE